MSIKVVPVNRRQPPGFREHVGESGVNREKNFITEIVQSPFQRPQSGNSVLVSDGQLGAEGHPAKHLFGLSRASVESCP